MTLSLVAYRRPTEHVAFECPVDYRFIEEIRAIIGPQPLVECHPVSAEQAEAILKVVGTVCAYDDVDWFLEVTA